MSYVNVFRSFPALYWDKFVKKRVRQKFSENFDFDAISNILGMEKSAIQQDDSENKGIVSLYVFWSYFHSKIIIRNCLIIHKDNSQPVWTLFKTEKVTVSLLNIKIE